MWGRGACGGAEVPAGGGAGGKRWREALAVAPEVDESMVPREVQPPFTRAYIRSIKCAYTCTKSEYAHASGPVNGSIGTAWGSSSCSYSATAVLVLVLDLAPDEAVSFCQGARRTDSPYGVRTALFEYEHVYVHEHGGDARTVLGERLSAPNPKNALKPETRPHVPRVMSWGWTMYCWWGMFSGAVSVVMNWQSTETISG